MNIYTENQNDIIHETSVDFVLRPCTKEIHIVQYDKSLPVIKVELFRNGERYVLPENAVVNIRVGKLDHTFVYESVLGTNEERNVIYFEISEQMALIAGKIWPVLEVIETNKVACSSPLCFIIERNPIQEGQIESHDDFPIIYELQGMVADHEARLTNIESGDVFVRTVTNPNILYGTNNSGETITYSVRNFVDLTSNQTITGPKTFNGNVTLNADLKFSDQMTIDTYGNFYFVNGSAWSVNIDNDKKIRYANSGQLDLRYGDFRLTNNHSIFWGDKNKNRIYGNNSNLYFEINGITKIQLNDSYVNVYKAINMYAMGTDNSSVTTKGYVDNLSNIYVDLISDQDIYGVKTIKSSAQGKGAKLIIQSKNEDAGTTYNFEIRGSTNGANLSLYGGSTLIMSQRASSYINIYEDIYIANGKIVDLGAMGTSPKSATTKEYVDNSIASAISRVYKAQGTETVSGLNDLTKAASMNGDVYNVSDNGILNNLTPSESHQATITVKAGDNVVLIWNNGDWYWDKLASDIDLSNYATITFVTEGLATKVDVSTLANYYTKPETDNLLADYVPWSSVSSSDSVNTIVQRDSNGEIHSVTISATNIWGSTIHFDGLTTYANNGISIDSYGNIKIKRTKTTDAFSISTGDGTNLIKVKNTKELELGINNHLNVNANGVVSVGSYWDLNSTAPFHIGNGANENNRHDLLSVANDGIWFGFPNNEVWASASLIKEKLTATYASTAYVDSHHDSTKQDVISDLVTIRNGAALGATAVQPNDISDMATQTWVSSQGYLTSGDFARVATTGSYNDLSDKPTIPVEQHLYKHTFDIQIENLSHYWTVHFYIDIITNKNASELLVPTDYNSLKDLLDEYFGEGPGLSVPFYNGSGNAYDQENGFIININNEQDIILSTCHTDQVNAMLFNTINLSTDEQGSTYTITRSVTQLL